jgi:aconitate hydratase
MGVLPLQFKPEDSAGSLRLTGEELYSITGLENAAPAATAELPDEVTIQVDQDGQSCEFTATFRNDTQPRPPTSDAAGSCPTSCVSCSSAEL